jgi:ABC-2 type transport system ATP-binding protein
MTGSILEVDSLTKSYTTSDGTLRAVDDVSFSVDRGEIVGILGPNGAGKTTTIKCILGLIVPTEGGVTIDGVDSMRNPEKAYESVAAVLEGARNVYWRLTVRENLRFFVGSQGVRPDREAEAYDRIISKVGLEKKADEEVRNLSRGMKQKASLACALVQNPEILFLDEPTLGLDVEASVDLQREIRRLAKREDRTVVLSSHDMDVLEELCDRVIILNEGQIVANDDVSNLVGVFQSQTYELSFTPETEPSGALEPYTYERLDERPRPTVEVLLSSTDELYSLMETCRNVGAEIENIESVEPDLEEVFLQMIDGDQPEASPLMVGEER